MDNLNNHQQKNLFHTFNSRFGSDICTCRPYLVYALQQCVECAQRGGVGIVIYYRKEGRSLGEVVKFRVYNARENQVGGDNAETYFKQTEDIAGEFSSFVFFGDF